ncbi:hypothetical protein DFH09DRAFT_1423042, partial [Mycena vulgaris]
VVQRTTVAAATCPLFSLGGFSLCLSPRGLSAGASVTVPPRLAQRHALRLRARLGLFGPGQILCPRSSNYPHRHRPHIHIRGRAMGYFPRDVWIDRPCEQHGVFRGGAERQGRALAVQLRRGDPVCGEVSSGSILASGSRQTQLLAAHRMYVQYFFFFAEMRKWDKENMPV